MFSTGGSRGGRVKHRAAKTDCVFLCYLCYLLFKLTSSILAFVFVTGGSRGSRVEVRIAATDCDFSATSAISCSICFLQCSRLCFQQEGAEEAELSTESQRLIAISLLPLLSPVQIVFFNFRVRECLQQEGAEEAELSTESQRLIAISLLPLLAPVQNAFFLKKLISSQLKRDFLNRSSKRIRSAICVSRIDRSDRITSDFERFQAMAEA